MASLQHPIRFIDHEVPQRLQLAHVIDLVLVNQLPQPPRRRYDDVGPLVEQPDLLVDVQSPGDRHDVHALDVFRDLHQVVLHLVAGKN